MKYAIIAAGEGSRLTNEGISVPKPLVELNGEKTLDRLLRVFADNDADEIIVICNDKTAAVSSHLAHIQEDGLQGRRIPLRFVVKSTPSSMHSLYEISQYLEDGPFCLTTVDTVFNEKEFANYILALTDALEVYSADGLMGVTTYIDDEKPLYVSTGEDMDITGFLDEAADCKYISAGIYGLTPKALGTLRRCVERGESRMRNFQRALIRVGLHLEAFPFSKVLDIDHASDIRKAEEFLRAQKERPML